MILYDHKINQFLELKSLEITQSIISRPSRAGNTNCSNITLEIHKSNTESTIWLENWIRNYNLEKREITIDTDCKDSNNNPLVTHFVGCYIKSFKYGDIIEVILGTDFFEYLDQLKFLPVKRDYLINKLLN
jgi:hypothetical protein